MLQIAVDRLDKLFQIIFGLCSAQIAGDFADGNGIELLAGNGARRFGKHQHFIGGFGRDFIGGKQVKLLAVQIKSEALSRIGLPVGIVERPPLLASFKLHKASANAE